MMVEKAKVLSCKVYIVLTFYNGWADLMHVSIWISWRIQYEFPWNKLKLLVIVNSTLVILINFEYMKIIKKQIFFYLDLF